ncbi:hypothetical protein FJT64_016582 [Amphibalanus amphitrite]|uniref:Uncharacterized protein n=1 Tax=Amphibalanus amphitrite TaxID=1232801 RepID=A0A6A4XE99_AMPAM|nr:hypothetical protein FJT64_016582 [Amphibalanus amphitrite]
MIEATCSAEGGPERCGSGRAPSQRGRSGSGPDPGRPGDISYIPAAAYVGSVSSSTLPRSTHCPQHPYGSDDDADLWPAVATRRPLLGGTPYPPVPSDEAVQYAQLSLPRGRSSRTGGPSPVTYAQLEHQHHHNHLPPVPPVPPPAGWAQGGRQWADAAPPGHESSV